MGRGVDQHVSNVRVRDGSAKKEGNQGPEFSHLTEQNVSALITADVLQTMDSGRCEQLLERLDELPDMFDVQFAVAQVQERMSACILETPQSLRAVGRWTR